MSKAVYPGSFDPVTYGHMDIIARAARLFGQVTVGVLDNSKKTALFSKEERVNILERVTEGIPNVAIRAFEGFSVDLARDCGANVIVRGLRAITDFEYELQMAQINRILSHDVDTMFLATSLEYAYLSSSSVKEVAFLHGDISKFVPKLVEDAIRRKVDAQGVPGPGRD